MFNPYLRSDAFGAVGLIPILKLTDQFHFRLENYFYAPLSYYDWYPGNTSGNSYYNHPVYLGEIDFVVQLNFITLSLYGNYYSRRFQKRQNL